MNKILIENNIIKTDSQDVIINKNRITFKKSGEYLIEYLNCESREPRQGHH